MESKYKFYFHMKTLEDSVKEALKRMNGIKK